MILQGLGARQKVIRQIFIWEGTLLTGIGLIIGMLLALIMYILQTSVGLVSLPGNFMIPNYPISLRFTDFVVTGFLVMAIGILASLAPAKRAATVETHLREG